MIDAREEVVSSAPRQHRRRPAGRRGAKNPATSAQRTLRVERVFSDSHVKPFDQVEWEKRVAEITDDAGKVIFRQENVEVPKSWSLLATKVVVSKYFYGEQNTPEREVSVRQLIHRICRTIADWGVKDGYFSKADGEVFYDELTWLCLNQYGAFNSPVWFNVGLYHQYGVGKNSGKGNWFYNRKTGEAERASTQYEYPQCSACFIQSVEDNMESIMRLAFSEAMLFKFGSGTGTDLSPIRSAREKLSGGGRPSGPMSFLRVYDQVANVVKSGGKTRRAAKMNTLRDWHGDIEEFIDAKQKEEKKAWALIEQGYDGSYNGEAYGSVMYQNENLSVRASDEFMKAALEGREWWTRAVTTGEPLEKKDARTLLNKIAEGTWICGDPGMQYDGAIQKWHTCKGTEPIHSTNPCSEYVFINNTACNLASLNLMKFKREDGRFDVERFKAAVRIFITAQEILVDNASYPTKEIAENSHIFRTLGLGYANLGSLIMSYGLPYDSDEGRALAGAITAIMTGHAYEQSAEIAAALGPFPGYHDARCAHVRNPVAPDNVESMLGVIQLHREAVESIQPSEEFDYLKEEARRCWDRALERGRQAGYRNAQVTVLAPTGTIAFLMDCDTTGVEPDIALVKYKLLAGGGLLKIVNRTVPQGLQRLGYSPAEIDAIVAASVACRCSSWRRASNGSRRTTSRSSRRCRSSDDCSAICFSLACSAGSVAGAAGADATTRVEGNAQGLGGADDDVCAVRRRRGDDSEADGVDADDELGPDRVHALRDLGGIRFEHPQVVRGVDVDAGNRLVELRRQGPARSVEVGSHRGRVAIERRGDLDRRQIGAVAQRHDLGLPRWQRPDCRPERGGPVGQRRDVVVDSPPRSQPQHGRCLVTEPTGAAEHEVQQHSSAPTERGLERRHRRPTGERSTECLLREVVGVVRTPPSPPPRGASGTGARAEIGRAHV